MNSYNCNRTKMVMFNTLKDSLFVGSQQILLELSKLLWNYSSNVKDMRKVNQCKKAQMLPVLLLRITHSKIVEYP